MKLVEIFNVLVQRPQPLIDIHKEQLAEHGMTLRDDGRLVQIPADEADLPEGFDIAALRQMEQERDNVPIPDIDSFSTVVSYKKAAQVFDALAGMRNIDFRYLTQGCEARTHLMCAELFSMGIIPHKAWAAEDKTRLKATFPDGSSMTGWPMHVAPVIKVQMPNGKIDDYVIDPGLFNSLAPVSQWRDVMRAAPDKVVVTPYESGPHGAADAYQPERPLHADSDLTARINVARGNKEAKRLNLPVRQLFEGSFAADVKAQRDTLQHARDKSKTASAAVFS